MKWLAWRTTSGGPSQKRYASWVFPLSPGLGTYNKTFPFDSIGVYPLIGCYRLFRRGEALGSVGREAMIGRTARPRAHHATAVDRCEYNYLVHVAKIIFFQALKQQIYCYKSRLRISCCLRWSRRKQSLRLRRMRLRMIFKIQTILLTNLATLFTQRKQWF